MELKNFISIRHLVEEIFDFDVAYDFIIYARNMQTKVFKLMETSYDGVTCNVGSRLEYLQTYVRC